MTAPANTSVAASMEDVISSALTSTLTDQGGTEAEFLRDEHGRFKPRDDGGDFTTDGADDPAPKAAEKPAPDDPTKPAEPDPDAPVVLKAADPEKLATKFTLKDATGELSIPDGLLVEFTANGKARTAPLDRVVQYAQMGIYNHEREQRLQGIEQQAHEVQTQNSELERRLQERDQQLEWLLRDPGFRERAVQEYEAQNTPEHQQARLDREREEFRSDQERVKIAEQGAQYMDTQIAPAIEALATAVPNVSPEEVVARLKVFIDQQTGANGLVPPSRYNAINQYFLQNVVPWAQQLDEHRATSRGTRSGKDEAKAAGAAQAQDKSDLEAAQIRAQRARRQAATNLKPPGRVATATPVKKTPTTQSEIMDDVISSTLAAMTQG